MAQPWFAKYEVATPEGPAVRLFSFAGSNPAGAEASAVAAAAQSELAARPAATAAARRALYAPAEVPHFELRDGSRLPAVGLGTWKAAPGEVRQAVHLALQAGYRHIDCASVYQNEEEVGEALEHVLRNDLVPRSELYICGKIW